jgi:hypothetical protein
MNIWRVIKVGGVSNTLYLPKDRDSLSPLQLNETAMPRASIEI